MRSLLPNFNDGLKYWLSLIKVLQDKILTENYLQKDNGAPNIGYTREYQDLIFSVDKS